MRIRDKKLGELIGANYHTHTPRCFHAKGSDRERIETAIVCGYHTLGFSEHVPYIFKNGYKSSNRMHLESAASYANGIMALKEEYKNDIRIFVGYEMEYYPEFFDDTLRYLVRYPLDYLILSQHFLENEYTGKHSYGNSDDESLLALYVDELIAGMNTGAFTYVGHPNLFRFSGDIDIYEHHARRLCMEAKRLEIPLEANFAYIFPDGDEIDLISHRFFKVASEIGNQIIFGCDAHYSADLNQVDAYWKSREMLDMYDLTYVTDLKLRDPRKYFENK